MQNLSSCQKCSRPNKQSLRDFSLTILFHQHGGFQNGSEGLPLSSCGGNGGAWGTSDGAGAAAVSPAGARLCRGVLHRLLRGRASWGAEKSQGAGRAGPPSTAPRPPGTRRRQPAARACTVGPARHLVAGADIARPAASAPPTRDFGPRTSALALSSAGGATTAAPQEDTGDPVVWMPFLLLQLGTRGVRVFREQIVMLPRDQHQAHPALCSLADPSFLCPRHTGLGTAVPSLLNPTLPKAGLTGPFTFSRHPPRFCTQWCCHGVF